MPWFPVDDGFAFHHKAVKAGNAAIGLWTRAGSWCAQQLTDGHVPTHMVPMFGTEAQARRLVRAGLWHEVDGGYQFHGWTSHSRNPTRSKVDEQRSKAQARKAQSRAKERVPNENDASPSGDRRDNNGVINDKDTSPSDPRSIYNPPISEEPQRNGGSHNTLAYAGARARSSPLLSSPRELSDESSPPCSPPAGDASKPKRSPAKSTPDGFDQFWSTYPKRVGKQAAIKAWRKATGLADPDTIIDGARRYAESRQGEDPKFTAHPSSWLNAGRWDDEPQPRYTPPPKRSAKDDKIAQLQSLKSAVSDSPDGDFRALRALPGGA